MEAKRPGNLILVLILACAVALVATAVSALDWWERI